MLSAKDAKLINCHTCGKLNDHKDSECSRCNTAIHIRKTNSLERTWALIITGAILFIPANVYPIMSLEMFGESHEDTILSGIEKLFDSGTWIIGFLVLFASIIVPVAKLIGLGYLLLSVQLKIHKKPKDLTKLYRLIEIIGRWSMLDIFVIAILVSLMQLGAIATINAKVGATFFGLVVIITMFASASFDPRLIWDNVREKKNGKG